MSFNKFNNCHYTHSGKVSDHTSPKHITRSVSLFSFRPGGQDRRTNSPNSYNLFRGLTCSCDVTLSFSSQPGTSGIPETIQNYK